MKNAHLVYSTGAKGKPSPQRTKVSSLPAPGPCKIRLESKGRGGKQVTVLFNIPLTEAEARALLRKLAASLGCGGTMKDGLLELRGDQRSAVEAYFMKAGLVIVRAGG